MRLRQRRHTTELRLRPFCLAGLTLALVFLAGHVGPMYGQTRGSRPYPEEAPSCDVPDSGFLTVDVDRRGFAELSLRTCFQPEHEQEIRDKLPEALGCADAQIRFSSFKDDSLSGLDAACELRLPRRVLQFYGVINPQPLQDLLKSVGVEGLVVDLWVPRFGDFHCNPDVRGVFFPYARECTYVLHDSDPRALRFSFGYDGAYIFRFSSILGFLLLISASLALYFRRALGGFAYRRFLMWMGMIGVPLWFVAIYLLQANKFVQFILPGQLSESGIFEALLAWWLLCVPPTMVFLLCIWSIALLPPLTPAVVASQSNEGRKARRWLALGAGMLVTVLIIAVATSAMLRYFTPVTLPDEGQVVPLTFRPVQLIATDRALWVAGTDESIAASHDGGVTWQVNHQKKDGDVIVDLGWVSATSGYAAGTHGLLLWTADGGQTWSPRRGTNGTTLNISFGDQNLGIRRTNSNVEFTADGGANWSEVPGFPLEKRQTVLDVVALNASDMAFLVQRGFDEDNNDLLVFSKDRGKRWKTIDMPRSNAQLKLVARGGDYWVLGREMVGKDERGYYGKNLPLAMHSSDGEDWIRRASPPHDLVACESQGCLLWDGAWIDAVSELPRYWIFPPRSSWGSVTYTWAATETRMCTLTTDLVCTPSTNLSAFPEQPPTGSGLSVRLVGNALAREPLGDRCLVCPIPVLFDATVAEKQLGGPEALVRFVIRKNGTVDAVHVAGASSFRFASALTHVVEKWVFQPVLANDGAPIDQEEDALVHLNLVRPPRQKAR